MWSIYLYIHKEKRVHSSIQRRTIIQRKRWKEILRSWCKRNMTLFFFFLNTRRTSSGMIIQIYCLSTQSMKVSFILKKIFSLHKDETFPDIFGFPTYSQYFMNFQIYWISEQRQQNASYNWKNCLINFKAHGNHFFIQNHGFTH